MTPLLRPPVAAVAAAALLVAQAAASILSPPVLPLTVRNPYLSTWLPNRDLPWDKWPIFWDGQHVGMSIMVSVPSDNTVYPLLGRPQDSLINDSEQGYNLSYPLYLGSTFDASTTNLTYRIPAPTSHTESLNLTISFLSPITPTSSMRQSIPASYISVTASGGFDIDVYMDLNGQWVTGNSENILEWDMKDLGSDDKARFRSWQIRRQQEERFVEYGERAEWGQLHFTGPADVRFECGDSGDLRRRFAKTSTLQNEVEKDYRSVMDNEPVFAFHKSFKFASKSSETTSSVLYSLAHIQDEVAQYASARGLTYMRPLWKSYFSSEDALITFHYLDFANAVEMAGNYTIQLAHDARKAEGQEYADIVALSARQVLGATIFSGTPDNPLIFLKEISSDGNTQTVDVIFPAWPFFVYTNPRWLAWLLEPLLEHQLSGQYPNKYSMHDLGSHFPNLTGHADGNDEYMPVEECGDMLIMGLSLVQSLTYDLAETASSMWASLGQQLSMSEVDEKLSPFALLADADEGSATFGLDNKWGGGAEGVKQARLWLDRSFPIWKQWTEYLIDESLIPGNQLCTDDFAGWLPLQTNLALKGIIGIKAMSELSRVMGLESEVKYYQNISDTYIRKWQGYGISRDGTHAKLAYDWYGSWTTLYSLFADAILCFHPHPSSASETAAAAVAAADTTPRLPAAAQHPLTTNSKNQTTPQNFIPHSLYANQSAWYALSLQHYGLPLDSRHLYAKSDWMLEVAAVASPAVRTRLVHSLARWLNETESDLPFTDLFETEGRGGFGAGNRFAARPVVGAHFSLLALGRSCRGFWGGAEWEG